MSNIKQLQSRLGTCEICEVSFSYYPSVQPGRFCSPQCHGIAKSPNIRRDLLNPEYVQKRYQEDGLTSIQLAKELNMSKRTLLRRMKEWGIERRKPTGRMKATDGYILIKIPDHPRANALGYVREHRLVMEKMLGRYLEPKEIIHHKNSIRDDNRPENLELMESNSEHHKKHHNEPEHMRAMQARGRETARKKALARVAEPRFCECGCGEQLQLDYRRHIPANMPRFIFGHAKRASYDRQFEEWVKEHQGSTCQCGCGGLLTFTRNDFKHKRRVRRFLHGHNGKLLKKSGRCP